jgi:hypothetical protein
MEAALDAGARIVNDVSALTHDAESAALIARRGASVVLMHMRGEPRTMQCDPVYDSPLIEVLEFLKLRIETCIAAGISIENLAIDPGIGFGKRVSQNLELLSGIASFHTLGCGIVVGVSRKSTIAEGAPARFPCGRAIRGSARCSNRAGPRCRRDAPGARGVARHRSELSRIHPGGVQAGRARSRVAPTPSASGKTSSFSTETRTSATRGSAKQIVQTRSAKPSHKSICPEFATSRIAATTFS